MLTYTDSDLTGSLVSEKYDGVQARWDGTRLLSRDGHTFDAPDWFTAGLPSYLLVGELWCGRGQFERTLSIVTRHGAGLEWEEVRYMVFDAPPDVGDLGPYAEPVRRWPATDCETLLADRDRIVASGGEGLVVRCPDGFDYKLKPITDDDARVIGHAAGKGRNADRCGALLVEDRQGRRFRLGSGLTDAHRDEPPAVGCVVAYQYQGRTARGLPRFAVFLRKRAETCLAF